MNLYENVMTEFLDNSLPVYFEGISSHNIYWILEKLKDEDFFKYNDKHTILTQYVHRKISEAFYS